MKSLSRQLRGTKINPLNKPRRVQESSSYNYQVDLYMEIDYAFITKAGGTMEAALNYINSLVTAANGKFANTIHTFSVNSKRAYQQTLLLRSENSRVRERD